MKGQKYVEAKTFSGMPLECAFSPEGYETHTYIFQAL